MDDHTPTPQRRMFPKTRARFEKWAETNQKVQKVKHHVEEHKELYVGGPVLLGVGFVGGKQFRRPIVINNTVAPVIAPVMNNIGNVVNNTVNNLGPCCKIVQDLDNPNKLWPKITALAEELAEEHGITVEAARKMLSRHFRGDLTTVYGKRYAPYGVTTTG